MSTRTEICITLLWSLYLYATIFLKKYSFVNLPKIVCPNILLFPPPKSKKNDPANIPTDLTSQELNIFRYATALDPVLCKGEK